MIWFCVVLLFTGALTMLEPPDCFSGNDAPALSADFCSTVDADVGAGASGDLEPPSLLNG
jgi:hypothetical protein